MSEGYPDFFTEEQKKQLETKVEDAVPANIKHKWLYSVVPISGPSYIQFTQSGQEYVSSIVAVLAGYCPQCGRACSKIIPVNIDGTYSETPMDVERYGCIVPEA